jgi:hypothetical protein
LFFERPFGKGRVFVFLVFMSEAARLSRRFFAAMRLFRCSVCFIFSGSSANGSVYFQMTFILSGAYTLIFLTNLSMSFCVDNRLADKYGVRIAGTW